MSRYGPGVKEIPLGATVVVQVSGEVRVSPREVDRR